MYSGEGEESEDDDYGEEQSDSPQSAGRSSDAYGDNEEEDEYVEGWDFVRPDSLDVMAEKER